MMLFWAPCPKKMTYFDYGTILMVPREERSDGPKRKLSSTTNNFIRKFNLPHEDIVMRKVVSIMERTI